MEVDTVFRVPQAVEGGYPQVVFPSRDGIDPILSATVVTPVCDASVTSRNRFDAGVDAGEGFAPLVLVYSSPEVMSKE